MNDIKVGDRVTCIKDNSFPSQINEGSIINLIKGRDYIVYGMSTSTCCGRVLLDVGLIGNPNGLVNCTQGHSYTINSNIDWKDASRFAKKEEQTNVSAIKLTEQLVLSEN